MTVLIKTTAAMEAQLYSRVQAWIPHWLQKQAGILYSASGGFFDTHTHDTNKNVVYDSHEYRLGYSLVSVGLPKGN